MSLVGASLMEEAGRPRIRLTFGYDPGLIAVVKSVSGWKFHPKRTVGGFWSVPFSVDVCEELRRKLTIYLKPTDELRALYLADKDRIKANAKLRASGDATFDDYEFATPPFAHQRMGLRFLLDNPRAGLLWEPGTGKTKTVIDDVLYRKQHDLIHGPTLIVCPMEVVSVWKRQVPLHSGGRLTVDVIDPDESSAAKSDRLLTTRADFVVTNVDSLIRLDKAVVDAFWANIVYDEVTRFKTVTAQRTRVALKLKSELSRILTGTPITNSPIDAYAPFTLLDPALFGRWFTFKDRYLMYGGYGGHEVIAYKRLDELKEKVHRYATRVLKADCLDLPPKLPVEYVEIELKGETLEHYERMRDELRTWWGEARDDQQVSARLAITQLMRLSQIAGGLLQEGGNFRWLTGNPKQRQLEQELIDLPPNGKLVVFAIYQKEIEALRDHFTGWLPRGLEPVEQRAWVPLNPRTIYGGVKPAEREAAQQAFQEGDCRLIICQIHSGGIGIDLYASQTGVRYTRNYSYEDYVQSGDRLHRIGQQGTVVLKDYVAKLPLKRGKRPMSIDDSLTKKLLMKQDFADLITGDADRVDVKAQRAVVSEIMEEVLG